ncbi:MAG: hypothetical protein ACJ779_03565, partial [Chloroflexota bacterium]
TSFLTTLFDLTRGGYDATTQAGKLAWAASTPYFDVASGSNGTCSPSVLCTAGIGWDGPTGRGSIATSTVTPVLTSITVSPTSATVQTGGTKQYTATAKDQSGQAMSPQPTFTWSVGGDSTIDRSGALTAGTTTGTFTVTAASGSVSGTASVTVSNAPADFSVSVSPASQSVKRSGTATYTVTIAGTNGFAGSVLLSLTGQPSGSTVTFTPNPTTTGTSTLKIRTKSTTTRATYALTIKGVSGSLTRTATASLTVTR